MKRNISFAIIISFFALGARAQSADLRVVDSLEKVIHQVPDTTKVIIHLKIARELMFNEGNKSVKQIQKAIALSSGIDYKDGLGLSYSLLGGYYLLVKNDFNTSRKYLDSALLPNQSPRTLRVVYYINSMWHSQRGEFDDSHNYLANALRLSGSIQDDTTAMICDVLGYNLNKIGRKKEAVQYYLKSIGIYERKGNNSLALSKLAATLNNLATVYMDRDKPDSALNIFRRVYAIESKFGNPGDNPSLLGNLGKLYLANGKDDSAYYFMHSALRAPSI